MCNHCEKEFAGGSLRITEHYAKCNSVPGTVKEWAVAKLGRSAAKREGKEAVKKMQGVFDDIARDSDQAVSIGGFPIRLAKTQHLDKQRDSEKKKNAIRKSSARNDQIRGLFGSPP